MTERYVVVTILAVVAGLIALGILGSSAAPRVRTTTFTLQPSGFQTYCAYFSFDVATGGSVTVTFTVSPGSVVQYVMTAEQRDEFNLGMGISPLGEDQGSAGTFTTALPFGGTYFVLSCHTPADAGSLQVGRHTMTITGFEPVSFYVGVVAIVITSLLVVLALREYLRYARRAARATAYPASPYPPMPEAPVPMLRTLHVRLENASAGDEALQICLNGAPLSTVPLRAGETVELDLHPNAPTPYGGALVVEVVSRAGSRAAQRVVPDAAGRSEVTLRLG